jgi:peroxiredoxin
MRKLLAMFLLLSASLTFAAKVGEPAPDFTGTDFKGNPVSLSQFKGDYVVLEWHNRDCPYVKKLYKKGEMQKVQHEWTHISKYGEKPKKSTKKGAINVVWLSIVSSKKPNQGWIDEQKAEADIAATKPAITAMLNDNDGTIGHAYGASSTPHMFIIDPMGKLVYNGAIDNAEEETKKDTDPLVNYVALALTEAQEGKPLSKPTSTPYGCNVKY